ncbi:TetR/AcrR family transcriptional regulator [Nocardia sp. NPDC052001]|uniref:TetR/AcrR family transcriptional regulator n=1 Tax=Nocardia sp. NPDC052001 TaxID=3154853 RepID=UPI0034266715
MTTDQERVPAAAPTGKRAERSRQAIVSAAREAFVRNGFDIGMDAIAASAGVSKVTVYNHFKSKQDLFSEVIGEAMDEAHATLADVRADLADAEDTREALIRIAWALINTANDPSRLGLRNVVTAELHRFPELGDAWQQRGPARSAANLAAALQDLCDRGQLEIPDPEVAVIQFFGLTVYPHLIMGSFGSSIDSDLTDRLIRDGVDMFLSHYHPPHQA